MTVEICAVLRSNETQQSDWLLPYARFFTVAQFLVQLRDLFIYSRFIMVPLWQSVRSDSRNARRLDPLGCVRRCSAAVEAVSVRQRQWRPKIGVCYVRTSADARSERPRYALATRARSLCILLHLGSRHYGTKRMTKTMSARIRVQA